MNYEIEDKQSKGHPIHVEFIGELKESQIPAVERLLQNDNGIMNAATAFGKTVVCCNVIAKRQVVKRNEKVSLGNCRGTRFYYRNR